MAATMSLSALTSRMFRATAMDVRMYEEVEADLTATRPALTVVVIGAVAAGVGNALAFVVTGAPASAVLAFLVAAIGIFLAWLAESFVMYAVGTRVFPGTATYGELLRTLGFAYAPTVLLVFSFIPGWGALIILGVFIWLLATRFIAMDQALDLSPHNTLATLAMGALTSATLWIIFLFVLDGPIKVAIR
jgi:hypothetical protein